MGDYTRCAECDTMIGHDIDCTQYPNADTSGLYIYRIAEVEALRAENAQLRAEMDEAKEPTGVWQPVMPGYDMMIHLHHPCFDWDILVTPIGHDEEALRGQGYISIAEVITLAQQADKLCTALEAAPRGLGENELGFSDWEDDYGDWYWGKRQAALKEGE